MRISGWLHTVRPIHVATQTDGNATGIATEPVPDMRSGMIARVPFVPATVLRGRLRRAACDIAFEEMATHGVRVPAEVFNAMRHGSNSGRMNNAPVRPSFFRTQRTNPVMGLFGGGPRQGAAGSSRISPLYPLCEELVANGMVPTHPVAETPLPAYRLQGEATMYPRLDMLREDSPLFDAVIEDADAAVDAVIAADVARRLGKAAGETTESTVRGSNILVYRFIVAGVPMMLDVEVEDDAPDQAKGMMVLALLRTLRTNEIGGMQRVGIGSGVFSLPGAASSLRIDGEPLLSWDGRDLGVAPGGEAERLVGRYREWSGDGAAWTAEELWSATGFEGVDLGEAAVRRKPAKPAKPERRAAK